MRTSPLVDFSIYDPAIKPDSTPSASSIQSFSKIEDLEIPNSVQIYATYEDNFWLLDGRYKFMPVVTTNVHVGWMSAAQSNSSGVFSAAPVLTINFATVHSSEGLTLLFSQYTGDWADDIQVQYYDALNVLIQDNTYTPTAHEFYVAQIVTDFKKIIITFNGTNKNYRYLRLERVDYGKVIHFTAADIKFCTIVDEIEPIGITLPIGTLDLTLFSSDATFNIIDPAGDFFKLKSRQPLDAYELADNEKIYMGQFFLESWENVSDTEITFKAIDLIGVLDSIPYLGCMKGLGEILAGDMIAEILDPLSIPYVLDSHMLTYGVRGWIPVCTVREAIQQVAFCILSSYANKILSVVPTCSRSSRIHFKTMPLITDISEFDFEITKAEKGSQSSLTLLPLVTGVEITSHEFSTGATGVEVCNSDLSQGDHTIILSKPMFNFAISGAAGAIIVSSDANHIKINVPVYGNVTITGTEWYDTKVMFGKYNTTLDPNVKPNIIKIENATLIGANVAGVKTINVYDYYAMRYLQKMKLYAPTIAISNTARIESILNSRVATVIEKMSIDLSGGFVCDVEANGVIFAESS